MDAVAQSSVVVSLVRRLRTCCLFFSPSKKTILVDKNTVGSATTGMSAGTLYCLGQRKSNTQKRYSRFSLEDKAALVMETRSMIKTMEAKGYDCGYHETGALTLALNEEEKKYLESSYKLLQQNKYEVEWLPNIGGCCSM